MASNTPTPTFRLLYNNKDITAEISKDLRSATYVDYLTGTADELNVTLKDRENANGDRRWMSEWYPDKGATLTFEIGNVNGDTLKCGTFEIDAIRFSDAPSTVSLRALSAGINTPQRTTRHVAYDDQTLEQIINQVAKRLGYAVQGRFQALTIKRVSQRESDLAFINRLAKDYGYMVKVQHKTLVFSQLKQLKRATPIREINRKSEEIHAGWNCEDQIRDTKQQAVVTRHNPASAKTISGKTRATGQTSADSINRRVSAHDAATAQAKSDAALERDNDGRAKGDFSMDGDPRMIAGATYTQIGYGKLDGKCQVTQATHSINDMDGYVTSVRWLRIEP